MEYQFEVIKRFYFLICLVTFHFNAHAPAENNYIITFNPFKAALYLVGVILFLLVLNDEQNHFIHYSLI